MCLSIETRYTRIAAIEVNFSCSFLVLTVIVSAYEFNAPHTKRCICITMSVIVYLYMCITLYTSL